MPLKGQVDGRINTAGGAGVPEAKWDSWADGFHDRQDVKIVKLLDWLHAHGAATRLTGISEFLAEIHSDLEIGYSLGEHLDRAGLVRSSDSLGAPPYLQLTAAGIARIEDAQQQRADRARRASDLRGQMLRWLFDKTDRGEQPYSWDDFLSHNPSHLVGELFSEAEVRRQSKYLSERGFLATSAIIEEEDPEWANPTITSRGEDCVLQTEGVVERYMAKNVSGGGNRFYGPYIEGNVSDSQLAWGNQTVSQSGGQHNEVVAPGFEAIADVASRILENRAEFGLDEEGVGDVESFGNDILTEVQESDPDRGKIRRFVAGLRGILLPIATEAVTGAGEGANELARQAVEALGNAGF